MFVNQFVNEVNPLTPEIFQQVADLLRFQNPVHFRHGRQAIFGTVPLGDFGGWIDDALQNMTPVPAIPESVQTRSGNPSISISLVTPKTLGRRVLCKNLLFPDCIAPCECPEMVVNPILIGPHSFGERTLQQRIVCEAPIFVRFRS